MQKKTILIITTLVSIILIAAWFFYAWYFQVLPQSAIHLLGDIKTPSRNDVILFFSPHPDDESLAAGGYLALAEKNGASVWIVLVTDGNKHGLKKQRYEEFRKATSILGISQNHLIFLNYPDGELKEQNLKKISFQFRDIISKVKPSIIIAPMVTDDHPDHRVTGQLVQPIAIEKKIVLYQYLVHYKLFPKPKELRPKLFLLPPVRMVRFDGQWKRFLLSPEEENIKKKAVMCYRTQLRNPIVKALLISFIRQNELFSIPRRR